VKALLPFPYHAVKRFAALFEVFARKYELKLFTGALCELLTNSSKVDYEVV
jgi:hypothetical protein